MQSSRQQGFILVLALMVLSIGVLLVTHMFHRGTGNVYFNEATLSLYKAQVLALSSLELAQSQLSLIETQTASKKEKTELLQQILPYINRWQRFELKENVDGINAQIQMMISCEEGKINVNQVYDFSKKQFKTPETKNVIQTLFASLKKFAQDKDLYPSFEKFLKERKYPFDDISEILVVEEFKKAFLERQFSVPAQEQQAGTAKQESIYLFDIFTVWNDYNTVQAWVLADSLAGLLGLRRANVGTLEERKKLAQEITKKVDVEQKSINTVWDASLQKWYSKEYKALPKGIEKLFAAEFNPKYFSVVCFVVVGSITQKLYGIIEREFDEKKGYAEFSVKKLYWI